MPNTFPTIENPLTGYVYPFCCEGCQIDYFYNNASAAADAIFANGTANDFPISHGAICCARCGDYITDSDYIDPEEVGSEDLPGENNFN